MNAVRKLPYLDIVASSPWSSAADTSAASISEVTAVRGCAANNNKNNKNNNNNTTTSKQESRKDLENDVYNTLHGVTMSCYHSAGLPPPIPNLLGEDAVGQEQLPMTCLDMLPHMLAGFHFAFDLSMGTSELALAQGMNTYSRAVVFFRANGTFIMNGQLAEGTWAWERAYNFKYGKLRLGALNFNLIALLQLQGNHTCELGAGSFWFSRTSLL
jgi:hypothetical protein